MTAEHETIEVLSSPHVKRPVSTDVIMFHVALALVPVVAFAVFAFGLSVLLMLTVATVSCVLTEHLACRLAGRETTVGDYSAVVTGLLFGLTLPPAFPLWMTAVGGFAAIALGKLLFGGLGYNAFNPALVGRAFLQASFPVAITTWSPPLLPGRFTSVLPSTLALPFTKAPSVTDYINDLVDGWTGATPLNLESVTALAPVSASIFLA